MNEVQLRKPGPRVLLAGMSTFPNQFSRGLSALNARVDWFSGDKQGQQNFPRFCDAVVIAKCQLSHQAFWDIKAAYLEMSKPVFIADHSYATIKEAIDRWVTEWKQKQPEPQTALGHAMRAAMPPVPEPEPETPVPETPTSEEPKHAHTQTPITEEPMTVKSNYRKFKHNDRRKLHAAIRRLMKEEKFTATEDLTVRLNEEGFKSPDGSSLKTSQVQTQLTRAGCHMRKGRRPPKAGKPIFEQPKAQVTKTAAAPESRDDDTQALLDLVLEANLDAERKVELFKSLRRKR